MIGFNELVLGEKVASGEFGDVFRGSFFGAKVAIKHIKAVKDGDALEKYVARELHFIQTLSHPNVVQFLGVAHSPAGELFVVSEWAERGDLRRFLYGAGCEETEISWMVKVALMTDLARAVWYVHARRVLHRDLKAENCLLTASLRVKLCDFGLSRVLEEEEGEGEGQGEKKRREKEKEKEPAKPRKLGQVSAALRLSMAGTDEWMAPEVALGQKYSFSADVFSLGVCFGEIALRRKPRLRLPQEYFEFPAAEFCGQLSSDAPAGLAELVLSCCRLEPATRPSVARVVEELGKITSEGKMSEGKVSPSSERKMGEGRFSPRSAGAATSPRKMQVSSIPSAGNKK